jgi:predicted transposase YbfD/YdcC
VGASALPSLAGEQICLDGKTLRGSRIEIRRCYLSAQVDWLEQKPEWKGLAAVGRVESTRIIGDKTTVETRYYLCSFTNRERFAHSVRQHWAIENQPHWVLDVQFGEDANRTRKDHAPKNLALIRRAALNLLTNHGPSKDSLRRRKLRACLSDRYRTELIFGKMTT